MHDSNRVARPARSWRGAVVVSGLIGCAAVSPGGLAQTSPGGPGLTGLPADAFANDIELAAVAANQQVFDVAETELGCNPGRIFDQQPDPVYDPQLLGGTGCTQDVFFVYLNARELVHTANELLGQGPTVASLGLDQEGLGLALRWTAAEELAAQSSMSTEFSNSQLATLASRLTALRFGATGFSSASVARYERVRRTSPLLAQAGEPEAAAPAGEEYSPWGGFLNYGFGYGNKAPTPLEDAFDFDGSEVTLGVDYRLPNDMVVGGILGFTEQDIDFDETASAVSVVDGGMDSSGDSFMVFALSQRERLTLSGSLGVQSLDYDVERNIKYPSFNPDTGSVNSVALSSPATDATTATFGFGYAFGWNRLSLEPFLNLEYLDITIDAFTEQRSINLLSDTSESRRFDLAVSEQNLESLKASAGVRLQYVLTPRLGVIIPHGSLAAYSEQEDGRRIITTGYAALSDVLGSRTFALPTDPPDESYYSISVGVSMIFRGGRQLEAGGAIRGGLTGFVQLARIGSRAFYDDQSLTAGLRYEF